jgi:hypothetical protein
MPLACMSFLCNEKNHGHDTYTFLSVIYKFPILLKVLRNLD